MVAFEHSSAAVNFSFLREFLEIFFIDETFFSLVIRFSKSFHEIHDATYEHGELFMKITMNIEGFYIANTW